jgi:hypothetical protein
MSEIKDDLGSALVAEFVVQLSSYGLAIHAMVIAGELSETQAVLHRRLRFNSFEMRLLAIEGVDDIAVARVLDAMGKVIRRFYGV